MSLILLLSDAKQRQSRDNEARRITINATPSPSDLSTLSDVAALVKLHRSEVVGMCRALGIVTRRIGTAVVIKPADVARIVKVAEASKRLQATTSK